jgi:hypothetical protein
VVAESIVLAVLEIKIFPVLYLWMACAQTTYPSLKNSTSCSIVGDSFVFVTPTPLSRTFFCPLSLLFMADLVQLNYPGDFVLHRAVDAGRLRLEEIFGGGRDDGTVSW